MSDKNNARKLLIMEWNELEDRARTEKAIQERFLRSEVWKQSQTIAITISKGFEWDTKSIIEKGWEQNKTMTIPKANTKTREMSFYEYQPDDLLENNWRDLWEPFATPAKFVPADQHDLIIVPGLLFNHSGYRIGYGGGFYDRYLQHYRGQTVSFAAGFQLKSEFEIEPHDQAVDAIVTNFGTIYCPTIT